MEVFNINNEELMELGVRVSRMRVSLRMKKRPSSATNSEQDTTTQEPSPLRVPIGPSSNSSINSNSSGFRSRLSSSSSVCSTDSGFVSNPSRSRVGSTSSKSRAAGSILTRIAKSEEATQNAGSEFSYLPIPRPVGRTGSSVSTSSRSIVRTGSSVSTSSRSSRNRSVSISETSDLSEIYSTIEELSDPFDDLPPPLPPRKPRMRRPALPPYPSTAVSAVYNVTDTLLC